MCAAGDAWRYVLLDKVMKKPNESQNRILVGVAWYRPEQWQRIRDISVDAVDMHDSYEEWLRSAEQNIKEISISGLDLEKVDVNSEQLILWCNIRGLEVNGQARSQYVSERLRELHNPAHQNRT